MKNKNVSYVNSHIEHYPIYLASKNIFPNYDGETPPRKSFKINNILAKKITPYNGNKSKSNIQISLCRRRKRIDDLIL